MCLLKGIAGILRFCETQLAHIKDSCQLRQIFNTILEWKFRVLLQWLIGSRLFFGCWPFSIFFFECSLEA